MTNQVNETKAKKPSKLSQANYKSDRISFVLDKELTPILKLLAKKLNTKPATLVNTLVTNFMITNYHLLEDENHMRLVENLMLAKEVGLE